jgi:hypothetical protein
MFKRLIFLTSFLLVLALVSTNVAFGETIEIRVAAGEDDSEEDVATGAIDLTSSDLEITEEGEPALNQLVGMRFNNIDIPQGAIITSAYVQFQVDETDVPGDNRPGTKFLRGEAVDNAAAFSDTAFDISSRPTTTAEASWDWPEWLTEDEEGPDQQTSDIAAVIQEIVDRPGWSAGNSLALIITGSGENTAEAFEDDPDGAPLLHVDFTAGGGLNPDIAISTQAGWFGQAAADREMQEIVDNVTAVSVELFTADQQDALADWVVAHTGDGVSDLLILCGNFPDTIYPPGNAQPDDSLAELFLDDGNTIVNTGDYMFYVNSGGTNNNAASGLYNMMDITVDMWDDNTPVVVTADGQDITPSLVDYQTDRPFHLDQLTGAWYPELILAQNAAGTRAEPVIVANAATGGRLGIFYQTSGQDDDPRGEVMSEWINNWYLTAGPVVNPGFPALNPSPADGAVDVDVVSLEWTAGYGAVTHKVYLSTDETIDEADLAAETDMAMHFGTLDPGVTYYWRVDEVDADGNVVEGNVWTFSTLPLEAHFPFPPDGATNAISLELSWTPGKNTIMHNVHWGTDPAMLLPVSMMQMGTTYDPGALDPDTTYYWRVDEFTPMGTIEGPVWSFSTIGPVEPVGIPDLIATYQFEEDASSLSALDTSGNGHHGPLIGDASIAEGVLNLDGNGDCVDAGSDPAFHPAGSFSISVFVNMRGWGGSWGNVIVGTRGESGLGWQLRRHSGNTNLTFTTRGTTGADDPQGTIVPPLNEWIHVAAVYDADAGTRAVYINGEPDVQIADTGTVASSEHNMYIGARANSGNSGPEAFFDGDIDDLYIYSRALTFEEIRTIAGVAELPWRPDPADGEIGLPATGVVLTWNPAIGAVEQDVYFGTDEAAVAAADASDTTGIYRGRQVETDFAPADLSRGVTYYWRVDGVTADGTVMPSVVWSLRVADRNTDNWAANVAGVSPAYLDTFVKDGVYDIGALSGDITYEFVVRSNPDETVSSMCLIGRRNFGDPQVGLKYEQWPDTGTYGATIFGVADLDYGVPTAPGEYTHLVFVSSDAAGTTELYVNGVLEGSVDSAITLSGNVGIGYLAEAEDGSAFADDFDGDIFGVAIYDRALTADEIAKNSGSYFTPIPITDPDLLIYYDFESGEGTMALDRSGHGNHGLFMGNPEWATGIFGGGVAIDIADLDYIQTEAPLNIVSNTVSVTGWVKHDESPAAWSGILTHRGTSPGCLGLQQDGTELRYMWGADVYWSFSSGLQMPNGEWYFAALTISPDQGKLYLNGIEQTATNVAPHEPTNFDSLIRVGRDHNDDRIMTSLIDEVRFYNRTLTDVDIQRMFLSDVTAPGDTVRGVPDDGDWPGAETPDLTIDDDTGTKYLHFKGGSMATGFQVEPAVGATIVTGLTLTTANDDYGRDPTAFELSGSNDSIDGPYTLIASGDVVDLAQADVWPRFTMNATAITFKNAAAYKYYQVVFPSLRPNHDGKMQIAEVELLGIPAPVAHWTFDEGAGTVALDSSGNVSDGTLVGDPQWVEGKIGGALEFDGDGDYVDCGNPAVLDITGDITVMCWIKVAAFSKTWETIIAKGDDSYRMSRGPGDGDSIHFGANGTGDNLNANTIVTTDTWRHVALVYNGTDKIIYIDGVEDARLASSGNINSSGYNLFIGENSQAVNRHLTGLVDDVQIYNQALSQMEIRTAMKGFSAGEQPVAEIVFAEDFESYAAGSDLHGQDGWKGWDNSAGAGAPASDAFAVSGLNSVEIIGSADLVHEFDLAGGILELSAMQYIPSGTTGTTYFILLNSYDDGANQDWSVQTTFNLDTGAIGFWHGGEATILYDQWVELKYIIDLDNNTVDKYYNGELIVTDQWDDNVHGTLGAIDLFGNNALSVYYDDIKITRL